MTWITVLIGIMIVLLTMKMVGCTIKVVIKVGVVLIAVYYACTLLGINI